MYCLKSPGHLPWSTCCWSTAEENVDKWDLTWLALMPSSVGQAPCRDRGSTSTCSMPSFTLPDLSIVHYITVHHTVHSTQYSTVHSTLQYRIHYITVQCRIQYSTGQYIQYSAVQYSTVQYSTGCSTCPCCTRGWLPPASAWWPRPAAGTPWSRPPGQRGRTSQWPAYRWVLEVATTFHRTQYVLCIRMFNKGLST